MAQHVMVFLSRKVRLLASAGISFKRSNLWRCFFIVCSKLVTEKGAVSCISTTEDLRHAQH